jgi:hypothetical protein
MASSYSARRPTLPGNRHFGLRQPTAQRLGVAPRPWGDRFVTRCKERHRAWSAYRLAGPNPHRPYSYAEAMAMFGPVYVVCWHCLRYAAVDRLDCRPTSWRAGATFRRPSMAARGSVPPRRSDRVLDRNRLLPRSPKRGFTRVPGNPQHERRFGARACTALLPYSLDPPPVPPSGRRFLSRESRIGINGVRWGDAARRIKEVETGLAKTVV